LHNFVGCDDGDTMVAYATSAWFGLINGERRDVPMGETAWYVNDTLGLKTLELGSSGEVVEDIVRGFLRDGEEQSRLVIQKTKN
jgi:hypothetical protein